MCSQAGKEMPIKVVALAPPIYMSVFKLPVVLYDEMESTMARFWLGGDLDNNKIHWSSWDTLCRPKAEGGLNFCDLVASTKPYWPNKDGA